MKNKMLALAVLFPLLATAGGLTYSFGKQKVEMIDIPGMKLTINRSCMKDGKFRCQAYEALDQASLDAVTEQNLAGGTSPGSVICADVKGSVAIGRDADDNERSFCVFPDGSMIDPGSLYAAAVRNGGPQAPDGD